MRQRTSGSEVLFLRTRPNLALASSLTNAFNERSVGATLLIGFCGTDENNKSQKLHSIGQYLVLSRWPWCHGKSPKLIGIRKAEDLRTALIPELPVPSLAHLHTKRNAVANREDARRCFIARHRLKQSIDQYLSTAADTSPFKLYC